MNTYTLKQRVKPLEQLSGYEDRWGDRIDPGKLANARASHGRDENEYVFFLSDFTFWGSAKKSVLATENGISIKYEDELQPLFIEWKDIDYVDAPNWIPQRLRFGSDGKEFSFEFFHDRSHDECVALFEELVCEKRSQFSLEAESLDGIIEKAKTLKPQSSAIESAISLCDRLLSPSFTKLEAQYNNLGECRIINKDYYGITNKRATLLCLLGNRMQAKTDLFGFIENCKQSLGGSAPAYFDACMLLASICEEDKEYDDAIIVLNLAAQVDAPDSQRKANMELAKLREEKISHLASAPREVRQMMLCVEGVPAWPVKEFGYADAQMLRRINWKFEPGHPQDGEMYVSHPFRPDCYYVVQSFHDRLFDEKRSELVYLLEALGARHVHVETMMATSVSEQNKETVSENVSDEMCSGLSGSVKDETRSDSKHDNCQIAIEERDLNPAAHPHIPDDLVWYPHEPSWQKIAQSALAKRYKKLSVELRYYEDFSINQKRMTQVQSALKLFKQEISLGWDEEDENSLRQRKATIWKYVATFDDEPIEEQKSATVLLSDSEIEYLDDLKTALAEGVIVDGVRRILERQRMKLGISPDRASELERSISVGQLSDDEEEYIQDFEDCLENGVISDAGRRMLVRRRVKLSISDDRAAELEQMVVMKKQGGVDK